MVHIVTDTTSGLAPEIAARYDIPVIPQIINFGLESYRECEEMDSATFLARLRESDVLPQTAAPPPAWFHEPFRRFSADGETILSIHPSAKVSGTVRSATVAKQSFPDADIRVMDTLSIGGPLAWMVIRAAEAAEAGEDADAIWARLEDMRSRQRIHFTVDTLEYLQRGGRIGGARALLGNLLSIRPILDWVDGQVEPRTNERTRRRALRTIMGIAREAAPRDRDPLFSLMHAGAPEVVEGLAAELRAEFRGASLIVQDLVPAIVTHGGPGAVGLGYFV
jgi:DegV family protein with EDD domain